MSQSVYAVYGSKLHLIFEDEFAEKANRAQRAFLAAQVDHKERTGTQWNPADDPTLLIKADSEDLAAWDGLAKLINQLIALNGGALDLPEEDMTSDDFLVKVEI